MEQILIWALVGALVVGILEWMTGWIGDFFFSRKVTPEEQDRLLDRYRDDDKKKYS